jgi:hypothetical protein
MPDKNKTSKNIIIPALELITALGIILFWIYFFMVENCDPNNSGIYLAFERAFPLADIGWLVPALTIGAIGLIKKQWFGAVFSLAGGGTLIFLALLDVSFNVFNGIYIKSPAYGIMNGSINLWSFLFGISLIVYISRNSKIS